jgi:hypothetical protein
MCTVMYVRSSARKQSKALELVNSVVRIVLINTYSSTKIEVIINNVYITYSYRLQQLHYDKKNNNKII